MKFKKSSWNHVSRWYSKAVGKKGHFYHQEVILPKLRASLQGARSVLDLACGDGVLARTLDVGVNYWGIDLAPNLIVQAKRKTPGRNAHFIVADVSCSLPLSKRDFDAVTLVLAVQDIPNAKGVFEQAKAHLRPGGRLYIVMNHPCFRIPKRSQWGIDGYVQYRRVDRYMSMQNVAIQTEPSRGQQSPTVYAHHRPLSAYSRWLKEVGFVIEEIDEWCSPKKSTGSKARMENIARNEFPLFFYLCASMIQGAS